MEASWPATLRSLASWHISSASARTGPRRTSRSVPIAGVVSTAHISYLPPLCRGPENDCGEPGLAGLPAGSSVRFAVLEEGGTGERRFRLAVGVHLRSRNHR